jgi:hypothetical protein
MAAPAESAPAIMAIEMKAKFVTGIMRRNDLM